MYARFVALLEHQIPGSNFCHLLVDSLSPLRQLWLVFMRFDRTNENVKMITLVRKKVVCNLNQHRI
jgi:hypothetical protein